MNGVLVPDQGSSGGRLGPLEAEGLGVLWRSGRPMPVREVAGALNAGRGAPLACTTGMTVMSRLARKGIRARSRSGRVYVCTPCAAETAALLLRGGLAAVRAAAPRRVAMRGRLA